METIAKIRRLYHVKGKGFKTIARELKLSKNTVKKIIRRDETVSTYQRQQQGYAVLEKYKEKIIGKLNYDVQEPKRLLGGSCHKGIYDNMKTAVKKVLIGKEREWNPRFLQMSSHHLFEAIACTRAAGWEKGQVENQVNTGRSHFFTPLIKVSTLEELNKQLEASCIKWAKSTYHPEQKTKTVYEVYQEEQPNLIPYRGPFDSYKVKNDVMSPYCLVRYATNSYSAECSYVGQAVQVRVYANRIIIVHRDKVIGCHERSFARYKRIYDPWHYVPLLECKPGALRNGAPFKQLKLPAAMQKVREQLTYYPDGDKRFIHVLLQVEQHGLQAVEEACAIALSRGGSNDTMILGLLQPPSKPQKASPLLELSYPPNEDCSSYNIAYLPNNMLSVEVSHA